MKQHLRATLALGAAALLAGNAIHAAWVGSEPDSDGGVTPVIIPGDNPGGNRTCAEVGDEVWGNAAYYQCWSQHLNYLSDVDGFPEPFQDISGNPDCEQDIEVVVTDDTFVSFTAVPWGIGAAIIKGGNNANVYVYEPQALSDSGLAPPLNASGDPAGLSNIGGFCWNPDPEVQDPPECFEDETAWAAGSRYKAKGNWATYTPYPTAPVTLWAGQHHDAGTVSFAPDNGQVKITIQLNDDWRFALDPVGEEGGFPVYDNNVKIQDYASKPGGNPAPGLFLWKGFFDGDKAMMNVPANNYYGVHVDVQREVDCPE